MLRSCFCPALSYSLSVSLAYLGLCFVLFQHQAASKVVVLGFRGPLKACKAISDEEVLCICSLVQINLTNRW